MTNPDLPFQVRHVGELSALGTALCWTVAALAFESAGRRVSTLALNLIRLVIGLSFLSAAAWWLRGLPLPVDAPPHAWLWLSLSGVIGFAIGDQFLLRGFVLIGSRLGTLLMAMVPPFTALIGFVFLGETLTPRDLIGMALTVGGVAWVVLERRVDGAGTRTRTPWRGIALGLGAALSQAAGLIMSKFGMGDYHPLAATQIRVMAGAASLVVLFTGLRVWPRVRAAAADGVAMGFASLGATFGPFLGVTLSLFAVQHTQAGVAATLMALVPVLILVPARLIRKEPISVRAVAGATAAVGGCALLFT